MNNATRLSRRAFSLRELTTITAVAALGAALFVPLAVRAGGESRMCVCMSRLKSISTSTARYGNDHQDALASLQSRSGQTVTYGNPGLNRTRSYANGQSGEIDSSADQAIDIIRRRGNRTDMETVQNWIAPANYSHLALAEYDREPLPSARWACPEDSTLLTWQSDPQNYNNLGVPAPEGPGFLTNSAKRWAYISSYLRGTYTWSPDRAGNPAPGAWFFVSASMFQRSGGHTSGRGDLGYRSLTDVAFPDSKVYMWDRGSRHFTPTAVYWNFIQTKQPLLFFDGATRTILTAATSRGWNWQNPNSPNGTTSYQYSINSRNQEWQPGFPNGQPRGVANFSAAHFATTREGLAGRDLVPRGPSQ